MDAVPLTESILGVTAAVAAAMLVLLPGRRPLDVVGTFASLTTLVMVARDLAAWWTPLAVAAAVLAADRRTWTDVAGPRSARIAATVGALFVAGLGVADQAPVSLGLMAVAVAGALVGATAALRHHTAATLAALATITAAGIYVNVPDTEQISIVGAGLGTLTLLFALTPPRFRVDIGAVGVAFVAIVLVTSAAADARGRPGAFIGVIGALGVFLAEPIARRLRGGRQAYVPVLLTIHAVAAITIGRIATELETGPLVAAAAAALATTTLLLAVSPRRPAAAFPPDRHGR